MPLVEPTVLGDVASPSNLAQQEVFGPVLSVIRFRDADEAIRIAKSTRYGLAAYVFSNDLPRGHRVAAALEAGTVCMNGFTGVPAASRFGGVKQSGSARMGARYGLEDCLCPKNVYLPLPARLGPTRAARTQRAA